MTKRLRCVAAIALFGLVAGAGCATGEGEPIARERTFDPVRQDPAVIDAAHPPQIVDAAIETPAGGLTAVVYEAQGAGPHPTVVLLHGFPGFERNLDLAHALRRAGWNTVFFHYRGTWGSPGRFSFAGALDDVARVVEAIARPDFAARHRIDPATIALVGHSMGGFTALTSAAGLPRVACVASLAGANLGGLARAAAVTPEGRRAMAASLDGWSGPVVGPGGEALVAEVIEAGDRFDLRRHAAALADRPVLLVAASEDDVTPVTQHHTPLVDALREAGARSLRTRVFEGDGHSFSARRIGLATLVVDWLETSCRPGT